MHFIYVPRTFDFMISFKYSECPLQKYHYHNIYTNNDAEGWPVGDCECSCVCLVYKHTLWIN